MDLIASVNDLVNEVSARARKLGKMSGFTIGNTAKVDAGAPYFTPLRTTAITVSAGIIVGDPVDAAKIAGFLDGKVDCILVDVENKFPSRRKSQTFFDPETAIRVNISRSRLWFYKGNDLTVDAVDGLLSHITRNEPRGFADKKIAILGAGNIGFKLALRLIERGADVVITRRNTALLAELVSVINHIKPAFGRAVAEGVTDNRAAASGANILLGTGSGSPLITAEMVTHLAKGGVIVDVGKGTLYPAAVEAAAARGIQVFRLDIAAAFEGLVHRLWSVENLVERKMGRRKWRGEPIVSGGILGQFGDVVVDDISRPEIVYGIANGKGDFVRPLTVSQKIRIARMQERMMAEQASGKVSERKPFLGPLGRSEEFEREKAAPLFASPR